MATENINRFTQAEQPNQCQTNCVDNEKEVMFDSTTMPTRQTQQQQHHVSELYSLQKKDDKVTEFPFFNNVNMLQKVHQQTTIVSTEEKECRFNVSQPPPAALTAKKLKCDECGLMYRHLSLLNHHKRIHKNPPAAERA